METKPNIAHAAADIMNILAPFESAERHRAVQAALMLLGESQIISPKENNNFETNDGTLPSRAQIWLKQTGINSTQLDEVFHITGDQAEIIAASIPGKTDKEKTLNAFVLTGVSRLIAVGDAAFDDKLARQVCKSLGCYNDTNHASYLKDKGNRLAGSKEQGWKLTAPGLSHGAALIKEMATTN